MHSTLSNIHSIYNVCVVWVLELVGRVPWVPTLVNSFLFYIYIYIYRLGSLLTWITNANERSSTISNNVVRREAIIYNIIIIVLLLLGIELVYTSQLYK